MRYINKVLHFSFFPFLLLSIFLATTQPSLAEVSPSSSAYSTYQKALKGDAQAQDALADMYMSAEGVKRDFSKAFEWAQKSARQKNADAVLKLGMLYEIGLGVEHNKVQAYAHYQAALDLGHEYGDDAMETLGMKMTDAEIAQAKALAKVLKF